MEEIKQKIMESITTLQEANPEPADQVQTTPVHQSKIPWMSSHAEKGDVWKMPQSILS